jgi:hypothetical protein
VLETLSESPKLFRISHFFSKQEADELLSLGLSALQKGNHKSQQSIYSDHKFTGDMMGDIDNSDVLSVMKRRAFDLLGLYPFDENMIEGFHVSESCFFVFVFVFVSHFLSSSCLSLSPPPPLSFFLSFVLFFS